jgi:hypothetical protein
MTKNTCANTTAKEREDAAATHCKHEDSIRQECKLPKAPKPETSTGSGLHGKGREGQLKGTGKGKTGDIASIRPHPFVQQWVANYKHWLCTPEVQDSYQNIGLRPINPSMEGMLAHHDGIRMAREARVPAINPGRNVLVAHPAAQDVPLPADMATASDSTNTFTMA